MQSEKQLNLEKKLYRIDKTAALEVGLKNFPSLYVEGAASSGKTTAIEMLIEKKPQIAVKIFDMQQESGWKKISECIARQRNLQDATEEWIILENFPSVVPESVQGILVEAIHSLPWFCKVIFVSREQPMQSFLDLIWKRQMEIIPQRELLFSREEVQEMAEQAGSLLQPDELYKITGGWAGCVDMMLRMADSKMSVRELRVSYEIDTYIRTEIIDTLSEQEQQIIKLGSWCPWFDEKICREVWGLKDTGEILKSLERKGLLVWMHQRKCWRPAPLISAVDNLDFRQYQRRLADRIPFEKIELLAKWYEAHGFIREALWYFKQSEDEKNRSACFLRHCEKVPFLGISYIENIKKDDHTAAASYLRGMHDREMGHFRQMSLEAKIIRSQNPELYLNLTFANPEISLDEWLEIAEELWKVDIQNGKKEKYRLFDIWGTFQVCLGGIRDLSGLFSCTKKEEKRKANIWKTVFGDSEWCAYCLARANFYLDTERGKFLCEEDRELMSRLIQPEFLYKIKDTSLYREDRVQKQKMGVAVFFLHCRLLALGQNEERKQDICQLAKVLMDVGEPECVYSIETILFSFAYVLDRPENVGKWMLTCEEQNRMEMTVTELTFQIRGYLLLHQYEKAARLLPRTLPYLKRYHMTGLYAEGLFQQAMVNWHTERHGQALQNVIESFLITGASRYVAFYTAYGKIGVEVLESYIEWKQKNFPGEWKRKKKYNYGNVLRMPEEDYLDFVLRKAKRNAQKEKNSDEFHLGEHLTMMETIILQDISRGLSNTEICEQQNLKITTVKSHIYNLYKKLGVNNRIQATLKGRELGIVK